METVRSWTDRDLRRLDEIVVEDERRFKECPSGAGALIGEAGGATPGGQIARPQMIWVSHREGSEDDAGRFVDNFGAFARALRG
ncbi:MAG: hypothetical protein AVDCRST_MAG58-1231 [uncultured Rubrobacteraceae bacterium]|uniref:Uncharacterized protein n=1 Tax=uncultured Rubrobacteraceae bacterium TaxID=349277 RepID=A0A6J4QXX1_9ACTN|nr:MAG: hypothetical protein AVDCRST_MAG58-1231 [uncultured Rubrobacteraceae bacterium]